MVVTAHFLLMKRDGNIYRAFAFEAEPFPEEVAYFNGVAEALDGYLLSREFHQVTEPPEGVNLRRRIVYLLPGREIWYLSGNSQWRSILVYVRVAEETGISGIQVRIGWQAREYPVRLQEIDSQAQELTLALSAWWDEYGKVHPGPWMARLKKNGAIRKSKR